MPNISRWIEEATDQIAGLPGIGRKTALRLVLHLIKKSPEEVERFTLAIQNVKQHILSCQECHQLSDDPVCEICRNPTRNQLLICVVQDFRDDQMLKQASLHLVCQYLKTHSSYFSLQRTEQLLFIKLK